MSFIARYMRSCPFMEMPPGAVFPVQRHGENSDRDSVAKNSNPCGPSLTESGFLAYPSSPPRTRGSSVHGADCRDVASAPHNNQPLCEGSRGQKALFLLSCQLGAFLLSAGCQGLSPDGWPIWSGMQGSSTRSGRQRESQLLVWSRWGEWWDLPKGTGRHIFTECMNMVIRDARAHV